MYTVNGVQYQTLIDAFQGEAIFTILPHGKNRFRIADYEGPVRTERDSYYINLTPAQLRALGEELVGLAGTVEGG